MRHGTTAMYYQGRCRCENCKRSEHARARIRTDIVSSLSKADFKLIAEALQEICPEGLTDDCPARSHVR